MFHTICRHRGMILVADGRALIALFEEAAQTARGETALGFFLTHAYVDALKAGDPRAGPLHERLHALGRD